MTWNLGHGWRGDVKGDPWKVLALRVCVQDSPVSTHTRQVSFPACHSRCHRTQHTCVAGRLAAAAAAWQHTRLQVALPLQHHATRSSLCAFCLRNRDESHLVTTAAQLRQAAAATFAARQGRRPAILRDDFASVSIKEDQGRDAFDAEHLAQNLHKLALRERQSKPRHLFQVVFKLNFVLVRGHEDDFKTLASAFDLAVGLRQARGKAAARRTPARRARQEEGRRGSTGWEAAGGDGMLPVGAKVQAQHGVGRECPRSGCAAVWAKQLRVRGDETINLLARIWHRRSARRGARRGRLRDRRAITCHHQTHTATLTGALRGLPPAGALRPEACAGDLR